MLVEALRKPASLPSDFTLSFEFDSATTLAVIGHLQLALRHPGNQGLQRVVDRMIRWVDWEIFRNTKGRDSRDKPYNRYGTLCVHESTRRRHGATKRN